MISFAVLIFYPFVKRSKQQSVCRFTDACQNNSAYDKCAESIGRIYIMITVGELGFDKVMAEHQSYGGI